MISDFLKGNPFYCANIMDFDFFASIEPFDPELEEFISDFSSSPSTSESSDTTMSINEPSPSTTTNNEDDKR